MSLYLLIIAAFAVRTTVRSWSTAGAPESAAYTAYRRKLARNLTVGIAVPVLALISGIIVSVIAAQRGETSILPHTATLTLWTIAGPGMIVGPMLALAVTELSASRDRHVATPIARTVTRLVPRWLVIAASAATAIASATCSVAVAIPADRFTDGWHPDLSRTWVSMAVIILGAILTVVTVRSTLVRPDSDAVSPSDQWSRAGIAVRAVALQAALSCAVFATAPLEVFRDALFAYARTADSSSGMPTWVVDGVALAALCLAVASFSLFARPALSSPALVRTS